jgi:hypothetical protein
MRILSGNGENLAPCPVHAVADMAALLNVRQVNDIDEVLELQKQAC